MFTVDPSTAARHRRYPSITLLVPLAGDTPWPARLAQLHRNAERRLRAEFGEDVDRDLLRQLAGAVEDAQPCAGARSLAVYVNAEMSSAVGLAIEVRERVVVDETFATRDLVAADLRQPRYWVLALTLDEPRLLHAHGGRLHEQPLDLNDRAEHPSTGRTGRGRDRSDVIDAQRIRRLRAIDMAITSTLADNTDPLVVVGLEPTLSRFLGRTRHIARIEGVIRRAPARDRRALVDSVAPAVAEMLTERRLAALDDLDRAVSRGSAESGIEQVWRAVRRNPGLLLVEATFEQPARVDTNARLELVDHAADPGVIDDAVDEVIEAVVAAGGRVEIVPDGLLSVHRRIAFVPAQPRRKR